MQKNMILVIIFLFTCNKVLFAQEFLKPQDPIQFTPREILEYQIFVREAFHDAFSENTSLGVLVMESFEKEQVIYVKKEKDDSFLYFEQAESSYWNDFKKIKSPKPIIICRMEISDKIKNHLDNIWRGELLNARYTRNTTGMMDGTHYSFYVNNSIDPDNYMVPKSAMLGEIQSPEADSRMGRFVKLTNELKRSCMNNSVNVETSRLIREFAAANHLSRPRPEVSESTVDTQRHIANETPSHSQ